MLSLLLLYTIYCCNLLKGNMEHTLSIPVLKTPRKDCSRDDGLQIQTLCFNAGWTQDQIILQTGNTLYPIALTPQ